MREVYYDISKILNLCAATRMFLRCSYSRSNEKCEKGINFNLIEGNPYEPELSD